MLEAAEAAQQARAEAERAAQLAWEKENPELAKQNAREEFIRKAMAEAKDAARVEAGFSGETWSDEKWGNQWLAENWGEEQEADFEGGWARDWTLNHGTPEEKAAVQAEIAAEEKARQQEQAKAEAKRRKGRAEKRARFQDAFREALAAARKKEGYPQWLA